MNGEKKLRQSITWWYNLLAGAAAIILAATNTEFLKQYPDTIAWLLVGHSAINMVLRLITGQPIEPNKIIEMIRQLFGRKTLVPVLACGLLFASCGAAFGQDKLLDISKLKPDTDYVLRIENGIVSVKEVEIITPNVPDVPEPPNPEDLTERGKAVRDAALAVTDPNLKETAADLSVLYQKIAESQEFKTPDELASAVKYTTDKYFETNAAGSAWIPVRALLTEQWTDIVQRGGSVGDFRDFLNEASAGLSAAAGKSAAIDLDLILKLVKWFIENILPLLRHQSVGVAL